jgi:hypothetical protein
MELTEYKAAFTHLISGRPQIMTKAAAEMYAESENLAHGWDMPMRKTELIYINWALVPSLCRHNTFIILF